MKSTRIHKTFITGLFLCQFLFAGTEMAPFGLGNAKWGMSSEDVQQSIEGQWQNDPKTDDFPQEMKVTVFRAMDDVAGYPATIRYFFWQDQFFQATIQFHFNDLENFDFNYNVYRSVNEYYLAIRNRTLTFVFDIYDLLQKKYGKKQPVFKGLDPRFIFKKLDRYVQQEQWNLRYHPYSYYQHIVAAAYARWDFPKTRVIFSVNLAAPEKRFDYSLSLTSLDLEAVINKQKDLLRMEGL